jgi:hypothetical protein
VSLARDDKFRRWESIERLVYKIANQVFYNRVLAAHLQHRITLDDLVQEGALTWIICMEQFDPDAGAKFSTYLAQATYQNLNRVVDRFGNRRSGESQSFTSLDAPATAESDTELHELIEGQTWDDGEAMCIVHERIERARKQLSPLAALMYEWMYDPPEWVVAEVKAAREQVLHGCELGIIKNKYLPSDFDLVARIVSRLWGVDHSRLRKIRTELRGY